MRRAVTQMMVRLLVDIRAGARNFRSFLTSVQGCETAGQNWQAQQGAIFEIASENSEKTRRCVDRLTGRRSASSYCPHIHGDIADEHERHQHRAVLQREPAAPTPASCRQERLPTCCARMVRGNTDDACAGLGYRCSAEGDDVTAIALAASEPSIRREDFRRARCPVK